MSALYYDLHLHSCLSPCGDEDMTPGNLVNLAKLLELDIIALTDHNTCGNCAAAMQIGAALGLTVIPGMELCTAEEVHVVCLFPTLAQAESFSAAVAATLPPIRNKAAIFGRQVYRDAQDQEMGEEPTLLITASTLSLGKVPALVHSHNGFCFPAHIDRSSYSLLSNLGSWEASYGFSCAELADAAHADPLRRQHTALQQLPFLYNSDAHDLTAMRPAQHTLPCDAATPAAVLAALRKLTP